MRREYIYRVKCNHSECEERGFFTFTNRKEYNEFNKKFIKKEKKWLCARHARMEEVLSKEKRKIETKFINKRTKNGLFFFKDGNAKNLGNGFLPGNGFRVFAKDFDENTILIVTAEIILPEKENEK